VLLICNNAPRFSDRPKGQPHTTASCRHRNYSKSRWNWSTRSVMRFGKLFR
jgi:hypothetical protein